MAAFTWLRLTQAITNLLANALKFTPVGGHVAVRCERAEAAPGRHEIRVVVEDSGPGLGGEL